MLDKVKSTALGFASKVAAKAAEVNDKVAKNAKKQEGAQYVVGLDIGTEFVKALIGKIEDDKIEIVGVGRAHQDLSDMQSGAIADIASVVENCDKALNEAEQQAEVSVRTAVIGIAG